MEVSKYLIVYGNRATECFSFKELKKKIRALEALEADYEVYQYVNRDMIDHIKHPHKILGITLD